MDCNGFAPLSAGPIKLALTVHIGELSYTTTHFNALLVCVTFDDDDDDDSCTEVVYLDWFAASAMQMSDLWFTQFVAQKV